MTAPTRYVFWESITISLRLLVIYQRGLNYASPENEGKMVDIEEFARSLSKYVEDKRQAEGERDRYKKGFSLVLSGKHLPRCDKPEKDYSKCRCFDYFAEVTFFQSLFIHDHTKNYESVHQSDIIGGIYNFDPEKVRRQYLDKESDEYENFQAKKAERTGVWNYTNYKKSTDASKPPTSKTQP